MLHLPQWTTHAKSWPNCLTTVRWNKTVGDGIMQPHFPLQEDGRVIGEMYTETPQ